MKRLTLLSLTLWAAIVIPQAWAIEAIEWNRVPIPVELRVGDTRILHFEDHVSVWRPDSIKSDLNVESLQGSVYLKALSTFEPTQIKIRFNTTSDIILLNVFSTKEQGKPLEEMLVGVPSVRAAIEQQLTGGGTVDGMATTQAKPTASRSATKPTATVPKLPAFLGGNDDRDREITPVEMMRFLSHRFYAPKRLLAGDSRMSRHDLNRNMTLDDLFIDDSYGMFDAKPVAAWKASNGLYATGIQLINKTATKRKVTPFHLNMTFLYASTQHLMLNPKNTVGDVTMLYVITDKPFSASLYEAPATSIGAQYAIP